MANSDRKKRAGITIDYSSGEEEDDLRVEYRVKTPSKSIIAVNLDNMKQCGDDDVHTDELVAKFGDYENTPPRTRMKIKNRDWDRKQKPEVCAKKGMTRLTRSRVQRRNTMDCAILNEMFINEESQKSDRRSQALLRESERDMKNSIGIVSATNYNTRVTSFHESTLESPDNCLLTCTIRNGNAMVESCNRYMSVSSRPIGCRSSAPPLAFAPNLKVNTSKSSKLNARKDFHEMFAKLIKLGSIDRQESKYAAEDHIWQTELKDLIWLELQAWQADRTPDQQDKYLFTARQGVSDLLSQIMNYRFRPKYRSEISIISMDSGFASETSMGTDSNASTPSINSCSGCLSLYCKTCTEQQAVALKEIEELLTRLEAAESLYPSSNSMASFHPLYKQDEFVGRVKAMCLWYNITRQHRLKLIILGKILARLKGERFQWPVQTSVTESSSSSGNDNDQDDSGSNSGDSKHSLNFKKLPPKVQFQLEVPSRSISSNDSSSTDQFSECERDSPVIGEYTKCDKFINVYSEPLADITYENVHSSTEVYRKYIEDVLKSRGLPKSLSFLHKLHTGVLYKSQISLEKPGTEDYDFETEFFEEDIPPLEPSISREQIDELRRYGYWSPEAKSIGLPSYIPSFVFLTVVPLKFIHEFLRMRLETRPAKPNPLSLEQLMKELREGLTLALTHRERYHRHISTALYEKETELEKYMRILDQFDSTVRKVMELYLDYVDQLVFAAASENHQKSALEKEWMFTKLVSPMIPEMHTLAANKFCLIIRNLLRSIGDRLVTSLAELYAKMEGTPTNTDAIKWHLLTICRETQAVFSAERKRSIKVLFFAKTFCRDVEQSDFHRQHYEEYLSKNAENDFVCPEVKEAFKLLRKDILDVRDKLTYVVERIQDSSNTKNLHELDDQDKLAILTRSREILHIGYKFGFEYTKDVIRLFEHKIMVCKDEDCASNLALGIITFAKMWMQFVTERCERGRGVRPRYASQGLEFLILACDPQITKYLDETQFENLKKKMDACISHVIGMTSEPEKVKKKASPRTRKTSSPAASRSRTPTRSPMSAGIIVNSTPNTPQSQKFLHPQFSLKEESSNNDSVDSTDFDTTSKPMEIRLIVPRGGHVSDTLALRQIRVRDAVNRLDMEIEDNLRGRNLIGQVKTLNTFDKVHIRARSVSFRWHRGIKIGQGGFGKVYTAVNNTTGELMAMKEITIQPGETRAIKNVADELKILEGINHRNLVKYYGIEIHREELLIFMELCSEGTLESLVETSDPNGLHEGLTRRFTVQLLLGTAELHKHGIVHRDIKTANIFLVDGLNRLKLGDFGSAVKIQSHTTVPGELQGYVGTQAYMAPEMFTKANSVGHGRAADIWSVGCVVVEMASGKRPWSQFDSNYQIIFKVGMGESPGVPESLSHEGREFIENCFQHDPKLRCTAAELLAKDFCMVGLDENNRSETIEAQGRRSFRRNKF